MVKKNTTLKDVDNYIKFVREFMEETDRAAVILSVAKIDSLLEEILKKKFLSPANTNDELFDNENSPLSSFSAKINVAYRMTILNIEYKKALHALRKIRNDFAHKVESSHLNDAPYKQRINSLVSPYKALPFFMKMKKAESKITRYKDEALDFRIFIGLMVGELTGLNEQLNHSKKETAHKLLCKIGSMPVD